MAQLRISPQSAKYSESEHSNVFEHSINCSKTLRLENQPAVRARRAESTMGTVLTGGTLLDLQLSTSSVFRLQSRRYKIGRTMYTYISIVAYQYQN